MKMCEHFDKVGKEFVDCGMEATCQTTQHLKKNYCKEHGILALVAGFIPVDFKVLVVANNRIDAQTPTECLEAVGSTVNEASVEPKNAPPHCDDCSCVLVDKCSS